MIFVYPYKKGSKSAKALAHTLGAKRIKLQNSRFKPRDWKTVVNWGSSSCPYDCLNMPGPVKIASDKLGTFWHLKEAGVSTPDWTTSREIASIWLKEGHTVVCRHTLVGSSGQGIELVSGPENELPEAPLYTKYTKKKDEYRVHVFDGRVIDVQRKMRKSDVPDSEVDWKIRNLAGGFIFGREGVDPDDSVLEESSRAVPSLGLLFGAVDVGYHQETGAKVYEVNTAPGLAGSTVDSYAEAIRTYIKGL